MGRSPIYDNVRGAPFEIGERVRVTSSKDETFDSRYKGRVGTIEYLEYQCGCGQTYPHDPMIGVKFREGVIEEFWAEELRRHPAPVRSLYSHSTQPVVAATKKLDKPKVTKHL